MYGFDEKKSNLLYSYTKDRTPNAATSTCFKNNFHEILNERRDKEEFSSLFYYLPSITNRKEKINQFKDNVSLNPIDCSLECLNFFANDKSFNFRPDLLNSNNPDLRNPQAELLYNFFNHMVKTSNDNLVCNTNHLLAKSNINTSNMYCLVHQNRDMTLQNLSCCIKFLQNKRIHQSFLIFGELY